MEATIAKITAFCGMRLGKKRQSFGTEDAQEELPSPPVTSPVITPISLTTSSSPSPSPPPAEAEEEHRELPLPPGLRQLDWDPSLQNKFKKSASSRSLKSNLNMKLSSVKLPRTVSVSRWKDKEKLNREDSIWKKTIMLGEKCKVPDDDGDAIIYDNKGKRITSYRTRNPGSASVSRSTSFIDPDAIPLSERTSQESDRKE